MCPLLGKYGKTLTLTCQKNPWPTRQPPPAARHLHFYLLIITTKRKQITQGTRPFTWSVIVAGGKTWKNGFLRNLIHSYSFIWTCKKQAGCNNNPAIISLKASLQFDIIWQHVSVRFFLHLKKQEMIWKTSLVAIGLKWMGHVVRLFRVGAIPNGDPSSRVPYSNSMSSYYENLPRKNISRVPWTMMYLPMAALEETKAGSWNEQRAFETFPSYDQVGAVLTLQTKTVLNVRFMIHIEWFFPDSLGDLTSPHSLMT